MIINILSVIVLTFLACGFVFAILFVVNGVKILDPAANNSINKILRKFVAQQVEIEAHMVQVDD